MSSSFFDTLAYETLLKALSYFAFSTISFVLFYYALRDIFSHRKIQRFFPKFSDYRRDIFFSITSILIFGTTVALVFHTFDEYTLFYRGDWDQFGVAYYIFTIFWMLILHDFYFYWTHRLMHVKFIYNIAHKVHHRSSNPSPWSAYAFHPLEAIIQVGIFPLIAFTLPVHKSAVLIFFVFQMIYNIYGHLGYELYPRGFHKTKIGRYINTSVSHNLHHSRFTGNFGLYFLIWDRLMGTIRDDYDPTFEAVTGSSGTQRSAPSLARTEYPES